MASIQLYTEKRSHVTMPCSCALDIANLCANKSFLKGLILEKCIFSFTIIMKAKDAHTLLYPQSVVVSGRCTNLCRLILTSLK